MNQTFKNIVGYPISKKITFISKRTISNPIECYYILFNTTRTNFDEVLKEIEEKQSFDNLTNAFVVPENIAFSLADKIITYDNEDEYHKTFHIPREEEWCVQFHTQNQFEKICREFYKIGYHYGTGTRHNSPMTLLEEGKAQFNGECYITIDATKKYANFVFISRGKGENTKVYDYEEIFY